MYFNENTDLIIGSLSKTDILQAAHNSEVIMSAVSSQITGVSIVCSTVYSGAIKENLKAPRHWPLYGESSGDRWIPLTKGQ